MKETLAVFKREFNGYFATPLACVFIVIYVFCANALAFYLGGYFERGQADLQPFFSFHPWLYLFLVPAVAMRLWAEERRIGTIELLLSLPIPLWAAVAGKFLAAWAFIGVALALTFPMWISAAWLGDPDHGAILAGYTGSFFMAGGYLAIGSCLSATTRNQVIAFVVSVVTCFLFTISSLPVVTGFFAVWAPQAVIATIASFSFLTHFEAISQGVIDLRDLIYFSTLISVWLAATIIVIDMKRAE